MDLVHRRALAPDGWPFLSAASKDLRPAPLGDETAALIAALTGGRAPTEPEWIAALTHGSTGAGADYQRLEFLGDRVLALVIAEWLHEAKGADEGQLSQRLNALVARAMCANIARARDLPPHIRLGKQALGDGGADSDNILGDVVEALIGACYITRGFEVARAMVRLLWADAIAGRAGTAKHPKSALQEWAAGNRRKLPEYRLVSRDGPDHAARFTVAVAVPGVGEAEACAASKQEAETLAAAEFIRRFG